jgi:hypothetical protein
LSAESSLAEALAATDFRVRCRLSVPPRGLGDRPITIWCRVSLPMLKNPRTGRSDAGRGSDTCSPGSPLRGRASGQGIDFSREKGRLSVPPRGLGDSPSTVWCRVSFTTLKNPRIGRPDASKAFHGALDGPIRRPLPESAHRPKMRMSAVGSGEFEPW